MTSSVSASELRTSTVRDDEMGDDFKQAAGFANEGWSTQRRESNQNLTTEPLETTQVSTI